MATIVLAVAGNALLPGVGGIAGAAIGGYLDSTYLYPTIFPPKDIVGPRINEIDGQAFSEGAPVHRVFGPEIRVPGTVLWMSRLREIEIAEGGGKKGGPTALRYEYFVDLAVAIGRGLVSKVKKIWANGNLLYSDNPNISVVSNLIAARPIVSSLSQEVGVGLPISQQDDFLAFMDLSIPTATFDFTQFRSGLNVTVSGFTNVANVGSFFVVRSWNDGAGNSWLRLRNDAAVRELQGPLVTVFQTFPKFDLNQFSGFNFYNGSNTQNPDPIMEAELGSGAVPSYRGTAYVLIYNLRYLNGVPQFSFLVEADATKTIASTVNDILEDSGITSGQRDTSAITGNLKGYSIPGISTGRSRIDPLMVAYDLLAQEVGGKLVFRQRSSLDTVSVTESELSAHEEQQDIRRPVEFGEIPENKLPSEVAIQYLDPKIDHQRGSQVERRRNFLTENKISIDVRMTFDASEARAIAGRLLWNTVRNQQTVRLTLPASYLSVQENDRLSIPIDGELYSVITQEVTRGANGIMEITGIVDDIMTFAAGADDPLSSGQKIGVPASVHVEVIDVAPFRDEDNTTIGVYFAAANADDKEPWKGAAIYLGDSPSFMSFAAQARVAAVIGEAEVEEAQTIVTHDSADSNVILSGQWGTRVDANAHGGSHLLNELGDGVTIPFATCKFVTTIPETGVYEVLFRWLATFNNNTAAKVDVVHASGTATIHVDQRQQLGVDSWFRLGEWTFNAGTAEVTITGNGAGTVAAGFRTSADAVRYRRTDDLNALPSGVVGYWDRVNTVKVRIFSGSLESKTEAEVLRGENVAVLGGEVIAFQNATLLSENLYELSVLLRGLRDTRGVVGKHQAGERFVLLGPQSIIFYPIDQRRVGTTHYVKGVAPGEIEANIQESPFAIFGNTTTMFAPGNLKSAREIGVSPSGIRLTWNRRTRAITRIFDTTPWGLPSIEEGFTWRLEIRTDEEELITTVNTTGEQYFFSTAAQIQAGIATNDVLHIYVMRVDTAGRTSRRALNIVQSTV